MRRIYFTPEGIRGLLRDFAEGRQPSREAIEEVLSDFNDAEWRVDSSLERLSFHYLGDRKELSLRAAEQLDKIRYGKIDIRRQLQEGLNEILTQGEDLDPKLANDLLGKVEALNGLIVALEEEHNYRARGR
ncbi:hypothetical protein CVUC_08190 [Caulobacter vibrioides]|nr:hypothetical protein CA608_18570 [Caulobacter vibrioides]PLR12208.1 hypothetical protein CVUC_08190 [Caulobacter vibrioides]